MSVTDIILLVIVGILTVLYIGGLVYCKWIKPLRVKLALAEYFPMYETERNTFIENSNTLKDKYTKVQKLQKTIDRLREETKYLTGTDLLIIESAIEDLKKEYAEVNADYKLYKTTFKNYIKMFYTLYPFAHRYGDNNFPLEKEEISYKDIKKTIDK